MHRVKKQDKSFHKKPDRNQNLNIKQIILYNNRYRNKINHHVYKLYKYILQ